MSGRTARTGFALHPRLEADTRPVAALGLCRVLLMNDARFPWLIMVPERAGIREIHQLEPADRALLIEEVAKVAAALEKLTGAEKMNVAALGNQVPQLHVHVIARFAADAAWPTPVWTKPGAIPYAEAEGAATARRVAAAIEG
ncbi:MAG: HIT domain-containing protein [Rhodospirillales bacterium]